MTDGGFKFKTWHIIVIGLILAIYLGYITIPGIQFPGQVTKFTCSYCGVQFGTQALLNAHIASVHPGQPTTPPTGGTHGAAAIQYSICDQIKGDAVSTSAQDTGVDILPAVSGIFDLLTFGENKTDTSFPDQSSNMYADGQALLLHVYSSANPTNGLDFYDAWYYVVLHDGNAIYTITHSNFVQSSGAPHYTYTISTAGASTTGSTVAFTSGTTNYWDIGKLGVIPRTSAAGLNTLVQYAGTTQMSITGGSASTGSSTANSTLTGRSEHIELLMTQDNANLVWGASILSVSSQGQILNHQSVIAFSTNMTTIDVAQLQSEGWAQISDNTLYGEKAYYKVVGPFSTTKGSLWTASTSIPIYCSASGNSQRYIFRFWVIDLQLINNAAVGAMTTSVPTAYGMISRFGPAAMVQAYAYTVSGGVGATELMDCWLITPSS